MISAIARKGTMARHRAGELFEIASSDRQRAWLEARPARWRRPAASALAVGGDHPADRAARSSAIAALGSFDQPISTPCPALRRRSRNRRYGHSRSRPTRFSPAVAALADRPQAIAGGLAEQAAVARSSAHAREGDRRQRSRALAIAVDQRSFHSARRELPDAQPDHHRDRERDEEGGDERHRRIMAAIRPSRARCRYSGASSKALPSRRPTMVSKAPTGIQTR